MSVVTPGPEVDIVMATFNGEAFLPEQLRSLEVQSGIRWRLIVADDGSSDRTLAIVDAFRRRHPDRVELLPAGDVRLGPAGAFGRLLGHTSAPLVALCDQDDVWYPTRLEETVAAAGNGEHGTPILVHSDLELVDMRLRRRHVSLDRYQSLGARRRTSLRHLLVQNSVTGCTVIVNRALLRVALPIPPEAVMHDWWLALVASAFGEVRFVPRSLVAYRQHDANAVGARDLRLPLRLPRVSSMRASMMATYVQAQALVDRYAATMAPPLGRTARRYAEMPRLGPLRRRMRIVSDRYWKASLARNLGMCLAA